MLVTDKPKLDKDIVGAIKALAKGEAAPHQQKRVVEFVLHGLARVDEPSYRRNADGGERDTAFAEGRRFVGTQLRSIVILPYDQLVPPERPTRKPRASADRA